MAKPLPYFQANRLARSYQKVINARILLSQAVLSIVDEPPEQANNDHRDNDRDEVDCAKEIDSADALVHQ